MKGKILRICEAYCDGRAGSAGAGVGPPGAGVGTVDAGAGSVDAGTGSVGAGTSPGAVLIGFWSVVCAFGDGVGVGGAGGPTKSWRADVST
jgi:hypothetical protein